MFVGCLVIVTEGRGGGAIEGGVSEHVGRGLSNPSRVRAGFLGLKSLGGGKIRGGDGKTHRFDGGGGGAERGGGWENGPIGTVLWGTRGESKGGVVRRGFNSIGRGKKRSILVFGFSRKYERGNSVGGGPNGGWGVASDGGN